MKQLSKINFILFLLMCESLWAVRLKDIAYLRGVRNNQLVGYGLVVGLAGTGDAKVDLSDITLAMMIKNLGVDLRAPKFQSKNIAAVLVSATLPPFSKIGTPLDITVSSVGTATSLDGGTLLMTPLKGPDSQVYAMAQGKILTVRRQDKAANVSGQTMVTAMVPKGALTEREIQYDFMNKKDLKYYLNHPDFTTASSVARKVNEELSGKFALASDAGTIDIVLPYGYPGTTVDLISRLEAVEVETDRRAKIVINQRSGTVVMGDQVRISPVAIAHGTLKIEIKKQDAGEKPAEPTAEEQVKSAIQTQDKEVAITDTQANAKIKSDTLVAAAAAKHNVMLFSHGSTIADIVASLNEMGASPDDMIALLQSIKAAGALEAEIEMQ